MFYKTEVDALLHDDIDEASDLGNHKDFHMGLNPEKPPHWDEHARDINAEPMTAVPMPEQGRVLRGSWLCCNSNMFLLYSLQNQRRESGPRAPRALPRRRTRRTKLRRAQD